MDGGGASALTRPTGAAAVRHSSDNFGQIGSIAAELQSRGYQLKEPPQLRWRRFAGIPRARKSDIRRLHAGDCPMVNEPPWHVGPECTCGKKARVPLSQEQKQANRYRRIMRRKSPLMVCLVKLLLELPAEEAELRVAALALVQIGRAHV